MPSGCMGTYFSCQTIMVNVLNNIRKHQYCEDKKCSASICLGVCNKALLILLPISQELATPASQSTCQEETEDGQAGPEQTLQLSPSPSHTRPLLAPSLQQIYSVLILCVCVCAADFGHSVERLTTDLKHKMTYVLLYAWQYLIRPPSSSRQSIQGSSASQQQGSSISCCCCCCC